jgi:hypothetical protein
MQVDLVDSDLLAALDTTPRHAADAETSGGDAVAA